MIRYWLIFLYLLISHPLAYATECILTIPKTSLLIKCVKLITHKNRVLHIPPNFSEQESILNDSILWGHFWLRNESPSIEPTSYKLQTCKKHNLKILLLKRDPLDLVWALDHVYFTCLTTPHLKAIIEHPEHYLTKVIGRHSHASKYTTLNKLYTEYLEWLQFPNVLLVSFEHLVGPQGVGSREKQIQEVLKIASFINKPLNRKEAVQIPDQLFEGTHMFKKGQCGSWKTEWSNNLISLFMKKATDLLDKLGYE